MLGPIWGRRSGDSLCSLVPCLNSLESSHCLCSPLSLWCSGSFYSVSGKKKGCSLELSSIDLGVEEFQLAFRDDMELALPLNEENCWIAVGEGNLEV